jgi:ABC-type antimicrobial peptide transport system permease subunit
VQDTASVIEQDASHATSQASLDLLQVSSGFFQSMSIPLLAGREFNWDDRQSCMLDGVAARQLFPNGTALGSTMSYQLDQGSPWVQCTVIGISQPIAVSDIRRKAAASIILPYFASADNGLPLYVLVRVNGIGGELVPRLAETLASIDPQLSITRSEDVGQRVEESFGRERIMAFLSLLFGLSSLTVAGAGLFSSLAFQIKSRTVEFGIRMALGADHARLAQPLVAQAAALCLPAIGIGIASGAWMSHTMAAFLFDPTLSKPWISILSGLFVLAIVLMCIAAALLRIRRLDPSEALRAL